jgi:hypothetical protein
VAIEVRGMTVLIEKFDMMLSLDANRGTIPPASMDAPCHAWHCTRCYLGNKLIELAAIGQLRAPGKNRVSGSQESDAPRIGPLGSSATFGIG